MAAILNVLCIVAELAIITIFSVRAIRVEQWLWRRCRRRCNCLRLQRQITLGKSHCR